MTDSDEKNMINAGLDAFEIESAELLEDIESNLLVLETSPGDTEVINTIFRAVHTIKGSSGVVGLESVENFAHAMENVLARLRSGEIEATSALVELMLESRDHIANLIRLTINGIKPDSYIQSIESQLVGNIKSYLGDDMPEKKEDEPEPSDTPQIITEDSVASGNWHISLRFGPNTFRSGMDPLSFIRYLDDVGTVVSMTTIVENIPPLESLVLDICYLGFEIDLKSTASRKEIEDVFEFVRDDCKIRLLPPRAVIDEYVNLISEQPEGPEMLGEILVKGGALTPFELLKALKNQFSGEGGEKKPLGEILTDEGLVEQEVLSAALDKQSAIQSKAIQGKAIQGKAIQGKAITGVSKTIRVETDKLDELMNIVGEMVIAQANVMQNATRLHDTRMASSASFIARLIQDLRESVNQVRMVPIEGILNRHYRTVRDICSASGKVVELEISGGETEIDRNITEMLNDPLLHLVRNAADHGIEDAKTRKAKGKPPEGRIMIRASQEAGNILIEVRDDGRGIDHKKVFEKAKSMGVVSSAGNMSRQEMLELVFHAGLSTKQSASNVSGRGVGMDVVRQNIEIMRGKIEIESELDKGTTISLRLPLTLAIIDGFMVRSGAQRFAIPLDIISECIELSDDVRHASNERRLFRLRDRLVPFIRLSEFLGLDGNGAGKYEYIVVVRHNNKEIGLAVDELFGEAQIVIKTLGNMYKNVKCLSGATILGDGSVAMILDVPKIIDEAYIREQEASAHNTGEGEN